jgi:hypothetical protein
VEERKTDVVLVSEDHDNTTQMYYANELTQKDSSSRGMRVKLTFTFFGNGYMCPIYVSVSGLSERKFPRNTCPSRIKIVKIPGLCIERNRDVTCNKPGYVVLLRNDVSEESVHLRNHEFYQKEVYRSTVKNIRKDIHNFEMDNITEIPDELLCVGWSDGDINHLKSLVKEDTREQCLQGKNIKCKQSAKRTGVEQPADVSVIFKLLKQTERTTTLDDIMNDTLSPMLDKIFKDLYKANELNLQSFKLVVLKDFLARLPYMLDKTCTVGRIVDGFVKTGLLDAKHKVWPDLNKICLTKRKVMTQSEKGLICKIFDKLLRLTLEEGYVTEDVYDDLGFAKDLVSNRVYERDHGIASEWKQRAKNISHQYQQDLRRERLKEIQDKFNKKQEKIQEEINKLIETNKKAEHKINSFIETNNLMSKIKPNQYSFIEKEVKNVSLSMLFSLNCKELKAFIHVRLFTTKNIDKKILKKYPNKMKFEDALRAIQDDNQEDSLVSLAFKQKNKEVILK